MRIRGGESGILARTAAPVWPRGRKESGWSASLRCEASELGREGLLWTGWEQETHFVPFCYGSTAKVPRASAHSSLNPFQKKGRVTFDFLCRSNRVHYRLPYNIHTYRRRESASRPDGSTRIQFGGDPLFHGQVFEGKKRGLGSCKQGGKAWSMSRC